MDGPRSVEDLRKEVEQVAWYHRIDLGNGIVTPGLRDATDLLQVLRLPGDLAGKTVLDIGAWDGFFSFQAERQGASRVLATDYYCWGGPGWGTKAGFELARRALDSRVEDLEIDVLDISPQTVGVFDIALFLGVLYHMRHPLLALERIASVTGELLIVETHVDMLSHPRPAAAFYPGAELEHDPTNWWGPNPAAVEGMLKAVGFREVEAWWFHRAPDPSTRNARLGWLPPLVRGLGLRCPALRAGQAPMGRLVVHARR